MMKVTRVCWMLSLRHESFNFEMILMNNTNDTNDNERILQRLFQLKLKYQSSIDNIPNFAFGISLSMLNFSLLEARILDF